MIANLHQFTVSEDGFIKISIVDNYPWGFTPGIGLPDKETYALIESSYCLPFVKKMSHILNTPVQYDAETKSFYVGDHYVIHTHA